MARDEVVVEVVAVAGGAALFSRVLAVALEEVVGCAALIAVRVALAEVEVGDSVVSSL